MYRQYFHSYMQYISRTVQTIRAIQCRGKLFLVANFPVTFSTNYLTQNSGMFVPLPVKWP